MYAISLVFKHSIQDSFLRDVDLPNRVTTPFTLVGNSADSPALFLRLSPATGHAAEILDVEDPCLGYDAEKFPYKPPQWQMRLTLRAGLLGR
jgi:hypothetical protein